MNVLVDNHHKGLFDSLITLFEKRLGYTVYTQEGLEWYEKGLWNVYPHIDTAKQYLERNDSGHGITYEKFLETSIDIVIASIPQHVEPFKKLAELKEAKFIFQMGNYFPEVNLHQIPNLMINSMVNIPSSCNYVQYHQEFDLTVFKPTLAPPERLISSFINVYQDNGGFEDFVGVSVYMPDWEFKSYGGQCKDGAVAGIENIAAIMNRSQFGFHSKWGGDGYGHVLYNWYACGKPVITRISDYQGKLGEELLEDGETCIDLDKHTYNEVSSIITNLSPDKYNYMCQQAYFRFKQCVDFDAEEIKIREFINNLK